MVIFESRFAGFGFTENLIDRKILAFSHYDDKINFISKPFRYEKSIHFLENILQPKKGRVVGNTGF